MIDNWLLGYCNCGCGEEIPIFDYKNGKQRMYVYNHHNIGKKARGWKGGKTIDSKGYTKVWTPTHPNAEKSGYIKEHILVMSKHLGRPLKKGEVIHHIDENKLNNNINNLQIFNRSSHRSFHNIGNKYGKKDMNNRKCLRCNSDKTYTNKKGHTCWYKFKDGFSCRKCWRKIKRN